MKITKTDATMATNLSVGGNLDMTSGSISNVTTLGTSGLATLNSASVTNALGVGTNATIGGWAQAAGVYSTSGMSNDNGTFDNTGEGITNTGSLAGVTTISANNTIATTANITAGTSIAAGTTLSSGGLATLNSLSVTNNATINGNLDMTSGSISNVTELYGQRLYATTMVDAPYVASISNLVLAADTDNFNPGVEKVTLQASGVNALTVSSTTVDIGSGLFTVAVGTGNTTDSGTLSVTGGVSMSSTLQVNGDLTALGGTNQIGTATVSNNTVTGAANTITATTTNTITGGTGNSITATTGNNAITATAGSNTISANAVGQSNTLSATNTDGHNDLIATGLNGYNLLRSDTNTIANAATYTAATSGIQVVAAGVDVKGAANTVTATGANSITAGTSNTITAGTTNTMFANTSNTLNSALNVIGNDATWAAATSAIRVDSAAQTIDVKAVNFNVNTDNTVATVNTIGSTNAATTIAERAGNAKETLANNAVYVGIDDVMVATAGRFQANATQASVTAGAVIAGTAYSNGLTTYDNSVIQTVPAAGATGLVNGTAASQDLVRSSTFVNRLQGNTLIDGNMYINGILVYTSSTSAQTSVTGGGSIIEPGGVTAGATTIVNKGEAVPHAVLDGNGHITLTAAAADQGSVSMTMTNGLGEVHGMVVTEDKMVMTGGIHSTSLTLDDNGATFRNTIGGGPVKVTGVADGTQDFDAVNYRQLRRANAGIAAVSAMSSIPAPNPGKRIAIGGGYGYFEGENALAVGVKAALTPEINVTAGLGAGIGRSVDDFSYTANAGFSFSF